MVSCLRRVTPQQQHFIFPQTTAAFFYVSFQLFISLKSKEKGENCRRKSVRKLLFFMFFNAFSVFTHALNYHSLSLNEQKTNPRRESRNKIAAKVDLRGQEIFQKRHVIACHQLIQFRSQKLMPPRFSRKNEHFMYDLMAELGGRF